MSLPEEPDSHAFGFQDNGPTREFLFAQALEACLSAERRRPGGADVVIAAQPDWAKPELTNLVRVARALSATSAEAIMSDEYRAAARARLILAVGGSPSDIVDIADARLSLLPSLATGPRRGRRGWLLRGSAGVFAAMLGIMATVSASASALPGEPLYSVKQAQEELAVRLAADDQARALALLRSADARLDETNRLLGEGRTSEAARAAQRYDQDVQRATTTFIVTIADAAGPPPVTAHIDTHLLQQQERLQSMLQSAPETARAELRDALVATERVRALVSDPRPVERALGRPAAPGGATTVTAAVSAEAPFATAAPTRVPVVAGVAVESTPAPVIAAPPPDDRHDAPVVAAEMPTAATRSRAATVQAPPSESLSARVPPRARAAQDAVESAGHVVTSPAMAEVNAPAAQRERSTPGGAIPMSHVIPARGHDDAEPALESSGDDLSGRGPELTASEIETAPASVAVSDSRGSERVRIEDEAPVPARSNLSASAGSRDIAPSDLGDAAAHSTDAAEASRRSGPPQQPAVVQPAPPQPAGVALANSGPSRDSSATTRGRDAHADAAQSDATDAPARPVASSPTPTSARTASTTSSPPTRKDAPASSPSDRSSRSQND